MGLQRVLFLAEVLLASVEVPGILSGWKAVELKIRGVSPVVSGRADSQTEPAGGCLVAASRRLAP
jgi:hypothetical protein